jgi:very-short-patch-repair endonuclease
LVVEVDGAHHRLRRSTDASRDRDLCRLGCEVLRIEAQVVLHELPRAVALIREALERLR